MSKPRVLVVYYSRSGVTARVARSLAARLGADVEEIVDRSDRSGPSGFVRSLIDALLERPAKINAVKHAPSAYELVVIATPVTLIGLRVLRVTELNPLLRKVERIVDRRKDRRHTPR